MELLKAYLKERRLTLAAFLLFVGVFAVSFALYGLPLCGGLPGSSLTGASHWITRRWNGRR